MGIDVLGSHECACGIPMDVRAGLTRGSYRWRTRDPWMMHNEEVTELKIREKLKKKNFLKILVMRDPL